MARIRQSRTFRKILNNEEYDIENPELAEAENMNIEDEIIGGATEDDLNKVAEDMEIATEEMDVNEQIANDVEEQIEANEQAIEEGNVTEEEARVSQECLQLAMRDLNMSESDITYLRFTTESINRDPKQVLVANNEALGGVWEKAKEMAKKAWEAIKSFFRKIIDFFKKLLPTRKNKLLKLQKILKDINGSSVHEEIQDEWDSVAEDKYMAFIEIGSGGSNTVKAILEYITRSIEENTEHINMFTNILKSVDYRSIFKGDFDNVNVNIHNGEYNVGDLRKAAKENKDKATREEYIAFFKELKNLISKEQSYLKMMSNNNKIKFFNSQSNGLNITPLGNTFIFNGQDIKGYGILSDVEFNNFLKNDSLDDEELKTFLKNNTLHELEHTFTKLTKSDTLDKSTAKDIIDEYIKEIGKVDKTLNNVENKLNKIISNVEKTYESFGKEKESGNKNVVTKVLDSQLNLVRKLVSAIVSSLNNSATVSYNYTVAYATHTIKGIKKKETDKENNK